MKKKILITGGSGFIGKRVKNSLLENDYEVITLGRSKKEDITLDLSDESLRKQIVSIEPNVVCHFASGSGIRNANDNKELEYKNVVIGTSNLLNSIKQLDYKLDKFIYLSSQAVYGLPDYIPVDELHPTKPSSVYGENKLLAEDLIKKSNVNYLIFRVSSIFGPDQDFKKSGVIASFIEKLKNNKPPVVFNSLSSFIDLIYVDDLVSLIVLSVINNQIVNEVLNVGAGFPTTLEEILNVLYKYYPSAPECEIVKNDLYLGKKFEGLYLSIKKVNNFFNWSPKYNVDSGMKEIFKKIEKVV